MLEIDILLSFTIFLIILLIVLNFSYVYIQEKMENYKIQKEVLNYVFNSL